MHNINRIAGRVADTSWNSEFADSAAPSHNENRFL